MPGYPLIPVGRRPTICGSTIDDVGISLTWRDLNVYVPNKKIHVWDHGPGKGETRRLPPFKRVVNSITGAVRPGSLLAVMGSSGAGKSTFLQAIANRYANGVIVDGQVLVNGQAMTKKMADLSGFVYQDDVFIPTLTPREHLTIMAALKLDRRTSEYQRKMRVEELLQELGLRGCQESRIGELSTSAALSGGERKRLAFAVEILSDPPVLFCDELTTGLDSFNALLLIGMLKDMAAKGKTVICTIHQPSSEVFEVFDQIMLLAEGRTAFLGSSSECMQFFEGLGHKCPSTFNPADYYIHTLSVVPGQELKSRDIIKRICDSFAVSNFSNEINSVVQYFGNVNLCNSDSGEFRYDSYVSVDLRRPSFWKQCRLLTWRSAVDTVRNPAILKLRFVQKILLAVCIGFIYMGLARNQKGIQDTEGCIFVFLTESSFLSTYAVIQVFPAELLVFTREYRNAVYRLDAYYLSKAISLVPVFVVEPLLFTTIAYFMAGMRAGLYSFVMTALGIILVTNISCAAGCFFSASFDTVNMIVVVLTPFMFTQVVTGGFFLNLRSIPWFFSWVQYFSWFRYSNEAMSIIQWSGVEDIECEFPSHDVPCMRNGTQVLSKYGFDEGMFAQDFLSLFVLFLAFHILGFLMLWRRAAVK